MWYWRSYGNTVETINVHFHFPNYLNWYSLGKPTTTKIDESMILYFSIQNNFNIEMNNNLNSRLYLRSILSKHLT